MRKVHKNTQGSYLEQIAHIQFAKLKHNGLKQSTVM